MSRNVIERSPCPDENPYPFNNLTFCCKNINASVECGGGYLHYQSPVNCCPAADAAPCPQTPCKMNLKGLRTEEESFYVIIAKDFTGSLPDGSASVPDFPNMADRVHFHTWDLEDGLLACGGRNEPNFPGRDVLNTCFKLGQTSFTWEPMPPMKAARGEAPRGLVNGVPWIIGKRLKGHFGTYTKHVH